jgi:hypothetical protein
LQSDTGRKYLREALTNALNTPDYKNSDALFTGIVTKKGTKYKIRITDHVKNLVRKDSTNVRLGLVVTETIGNVGFTKLKTPIGTIKTVPTMSALNPLGTILYGSHSSIADDKRLKLEIYYTKPN